MNLNYSQSTGTITDDDGMFIAFGWSGHGAAKNDPASQTIRATGPLPRGVYRVDPWEKSRPALGPMVAHLTMISGESFGRDAFYIHGPSSKNYGQESKGCIVVPRPGREKIKALNPTTITVTE